MEKSDKLAILVLFAGIAFIGLIQIINLIVKGVIDTTPYFMMSILIGIGIFGIGIVYKVKTK